MISKSTFLISLLLISLSLGAPSLLETRLIRYRENHQSQPNERVDALAGSVSHEKYSHNWAGAVWDKSNGTFTTITGTFTVPTLSSSNGSASAWVGIDGETCQNAILQTGVDFTITTKGQVLYHAWYQWWPDRTYYFDGIRISAGDEIKTTIITSSTTSGAAVIENLTTRKTVTKALTSTYALCGQNAEWIVEDFGEGNGLVTFADFGAVTFTGATAGGPSGTTYTPDGAIILDIKQNNTILTSTSSSGDTVTVTYV